MKLGCAPAGDAVWFERAWPLLAPACQDGTRAEVFEQYERGAAQLWIATEAAVLRAGCVTQSAGRTLHMWLCGGRATPAQWRALGDGIADASRGMFDRMTITARPGWARILGFTRRADGVQERLL